MISVSLSLFFVEGQGHRSSSPGERLTWRCACVHLPGSILRSTPGREGKGREGGKTGHKKVAWDAITTDTSADPTGSSGAWMALYKGPELRNEEMSLYIHVSSSHWLQAAPRNEVDPFKQRQLGIKEVQDRWAEGDGPASTPGRCRDECFSPESWRCTGWHATAFIIEACLFCFLIMKYFRYTNGE